MKCITKMLLTVVGGIGLISSLAWAECSWVLWDAYVLAGWTEQRWERPAGLSKLRCLHRGGSKPCGSTRKARQDLGRDEKRRTAVRARS